MLAPLVVGMMIGTAIAIVVAYVTRDTLRINVCDANSWENVRQKEWRSWNNSSTRRRPRSR